MRKLMVILTPLILAGCSKSIDLRDATVDQFLAAVKDAQIQKPGRWAVESRVTVMDLGSIDPAMAPMIRDQAMRPHTDTICVGKDHANVMGLDRMQALKTMACRIPHFTAKGGTIDGQIVCTAPHGSVTLDEQGQYTATTYKVQVTVKQTSSDQPTVSTATQVTANRVGDCTG